MNTKNNDALNLALIFTEDKYIPKRYKEKPIKPIKGKKPSSMELSFQAIIKLWQSTIDTMASKIDIKQASRFINLRPNIESNIANAAYCKDFQDFTDYFILRRDIEICGDEELVHLAHLHTAFQNEIDKIIKDAPR